MISKTNLSTDFVLSPPLYLAYDHYSIFINTAKVSSHHSYCAEMVLLTIPVIQLIFHLLSHSFSKNLVPEESLLFNKTATLRIAGEQHLSNTRLAVTIAFRGDL